MNNQENNMHKIRYLFAILFCLFISKNASSQDRIILNDKSEISTKVLEVLETIIKYKRFDNLDGPTYSVSVNKIYQIVYQNGLVENYTKNTVGNKSLEKKIQEKTVTQNTKQEIKKPVFKKYSTSAYEIERQKMYSEKKTSDVPDEVYKYALFKLPNLALYDNQKQKINLMEYLNANPKFKEKPTFVITWAWSWCGPCVRKIDTLLDKHFSSISEKFNLVIINRGEKKKNDITSIDEIKNILVENSRESYYTKSSMLYDLDSTLFRYDKNNTPLMFWLDKNLQIKNSFLGFTISADKIVDILMEEGDDSKQKYPMVYLDQQLTPTVKDNAVWYLNRELIGHSIKLTQNYKSNNRTFSTWFFTLDRNGNVSPIIE